VATSGGARGKLIRQAMRFLLKNKKRTGTRFQMSGKSLRHQQLGEIKVTTRRNGTQRVQGTGYHHRPGGNDYPGRRITDVTRRDPHTGVYEARVEFENPNPPPPWVPKNNNGMGTFFPNHWSPSKVDQATSDAFRNGTRNADGTWYGEHDGVTIEGWYDTATGSIGHGWPKIIRLN
jgi:hypothetical protein